MVGREGGREEVRRGREGRGRERRKEREKGLGVGRNGRFKRKLKHYTLVKRW